MQIQRLYFKLLLNNRNLSYLRDTTHVVFDVGQFILNIKTNSSLLKLMNENCLCRTCVRWLQRMRAFY